MQASSTFPEPAGGSDLFPLERLRLLSQCWALVLYFLESVGAALLPRHHRATVNVLDSGARLFGFKPCLYPTY